MEENTERSFLGTGWSFHPEFSLSEGILMVSEVDDIKESLEILLSTIPGERVLQPDYGCDLSLLLFEPLSTSLVTFMQDLIRRAILIYEPRVKVEGIQIETTELEGIINIILDFTVKITNSRYNLVYPFYTEEASNVSNT